MSVKQQGLYPFAGEKNERKGVEIGDPTSTGNITPEIEIKPKSDMQYLLKVTVTPKADQAIFKFKVKIPIKKPTGWKGVEIQIMGKVQK